MKFDTFLSYNSKDKSTVRDLREQLTRRGITTWFDEKQLPPGQLFQKALEQGLEQAASTLICIGPSGIGNWQAHEIRVALNRAVTAGVPVIPVLLPGAPREPELPAFLAEYHGVDLREGIDETGIDQLISGITRKHPEGAADPARPDPELPRPVESALPTVGGAVAPGSPLYIERKPDATAHRLIAQPDGVTLTIRGPRQIGKSSLLQRLVATATTAGKQVAYINVQSDFDAANFEDAEGFYRRFFALVALLLDLEDRTNDPQAWSPKLSNNGNGNRYLRKHILAPLDGPLVLAMDEVDRISAASFATDFFGMLRGWHNDRGMKPELKHLDLVLVISTEPNALIASAHQSPFNVATPIELDDFDLAQLQRLNSLHADCLAAAELERLQNLLNGHPYLTRSALYHIATGRHSVEDLFANALLAGPTGPFADHLSRYQRYLAQDPVLSTAMATVIKDRARPQDPAGHRRLLWLGLIRETAEGAEPRNRLYEDFFAR
ncbi:AAA-like domain-containing protein [Candidatus Thiosymbion oneisti]|uniref:AAA-like domain-containing protein n=1 Tax=Candidatus Thiosymbion oneisti TaxID=589554 RepID=UPI0013FD9E1C|nr:AAA-like domain-containing protein [Candidatus Thiosymbion oneisti]